MLSYLTTLLSSIQQFGAWGYGIVFLIALLESLVIVGVIVPGAAITILVGLLSSQGYLNIGILILVSALGAIVGDSLSYHLGTKGTRWFNNENKFLKMTHLELAEKFFQKHGDKSILIARFIGPIRPMVPFIAGVARMKQSTFLFWNIVSAFLWSASHLLIGYFFGNIFLLVDTWMTRISYIAIGILALFLIHHFFMKYEIGKKLMKRYGI